MTLPELHQDTLSHMNQNQNGTYPYTHWDFLQFLVAIHKPKMILEAGTAIGLTAISMAKINSMTKIDTIDKDSKNLIEAKQNAKRFQVETQITFHEGMFMDILSQLPNTYDMAFFDGFAPGLTVFLELESKIVSGGIFVCANLTLGGDHRKIKERMNNSEFYTSSFQFDDTIVGVKK